MYCSLNVTLRHNLLPGRRKLTADYDAGICVNRIAFIVGGGCAFCLES